MNNLILISTQFQLLNAIELVDAHIKGKKFDAILLIKNKNHLNQIIKIVKKNDINIITIIKYRSILQYFSLFFHSLKLKKIDNIIIGNCQDNLILFLVRLIKFKNLYAVDDGNIIDTHNVKPKINKKYLPIKFFTFYRLNSNAYYDFLINDFKKLKNAKSNKQNKNNNEVLFIGQPLIEQGLIDKENYINLIKKIHFKFRDKVTYVLHPREREDKFSSIGQLKTMRLNSGIEEYLISIEILPSRVVGFYSTALSVISKLFNQDEIKINFIDIEKHQKIKKKYFGKPHGFNNYQFLKKNIQELTI